MNDDSSRDAVSVWWVGGCGVVMYSVDGVLICCPVFRHFLIYQFRCVVLWYVPHLRYTISHELPSPPTCVLIGSSTALPFGTILFVIFGWGLVTVPLAVFGAMRGRKNV